MRSLTRICLGNDFSREAEAAIECAVTLARTYKAHLDLVHVVQPPARYTGLGPAPGGIGATVDVVANRALEHLQEIGRRPLLAGLPVVSQVRIGTPFVELIGYARESGADLVVIGNTPPVGAKQWFLGGTAERLIRKSSVPVLVGKHRMAGLPELILAPADFSEAGLPALVQAATLARQWGARLLLAHVIEPLPDVYPWGATVLGERRYLVEPEAVEPEWRALLAKVPLDNVRWQRVTRQGYAVETLVGLAAEHGAGLVVIGTHGRSALPHALLGSVAEGVSRRMDCCVMSVRHDAFTFRLP